MIVVVVVVEYNMFITNIIDGAPGLPRRVLACARCLLLPKVSKPSRRNADPTTGVVLSWLAFCGLRPLIFGDPYRTFGLWVSKTHYVLHMEFTILHEN